MKNDKCLTEYCDNDAGTRGLCGTCYVYAKRLVKEGKETEEKLVSLGMMHPLKNKRNKFAEYYNKLTDKTIW